MNLISEKDASLLNPLYLAFVGDAVLLKVIVDDSHLLLTHKTHYAGVTHRLCAYGCCFGRLCFLCAHGVFNYSAKIEHIASKSKFFVCFSLFLALSSLLFW